MGWSAAHYPEQMKKWWMCSKGKFCEEYMALLRTETSGGAGLTRNFMNFLKSPNSLW
jgi:hypothetical protein